MSLKKDLRNLKKRVDSLEKKLYELKKEVEIIKNLPSLKLTSQLPQHLLTTLNTIYKLEIATATQVAEQTKRARAVESAYLNQLANMGYLKKKRKGRKVYFEIDYQSPLSKEFLEYFSGS
ncbi:MAG: transcriptional regulator [Candidatus Aenigmarchaeota archaeon]|nr:transcriptional regulator [Candidatus Aenigmarchaeota archaeon]